MPRESLLVFDVDGSDIIFANMILNNPNEAIIDSTASIAFLSGMDSTKVSVDPTELGDRLKSVLAQYKTKTKNSALAFQSPDMFVRTIDLPPLSLSELRAMLAFELQRYTPLDASTAEYDLISLGLSPESHTVLLSAIKKSVITPLIDSFRYAGLRLRLIEPGIISMYRWVQHCSSTTPDNLLLLDWRSTHLGIMFVFHGRPSIIRTIRLNGAASDNIKGVMEELSRTTQFALSHSKLQGEPGPMRYVLKATTVSQLHLDKIEQSLHSHYQASRLKLNSGTVDVRFSSCFGIALGWGRHRA